MWTSKNRARYDRSKLRYPSDLTDDEWKLVEPLIPAGKHGGGKRTVIMREVVNGLMSLPSNYELNKFSWLQEDGSRFCSGASLSS